MARPSPDVGGNRQRERRRRSAAGAPGLRHYSAVVAADHVVNHKPAPDTFLLCAERMGVAPEKCVVFEDADFGLQAAKRAGMDAVDVCCERRAVTHLAVCQ